MHLGLVPVAGVGDHHLRPLGDAGAVELCAGGVDHRLQVPEVRRVDRHLGGDDDLIAVVTAWAL